jgi:hypothetical protein
MVYKIFPLSKKRGKQYYPTKDNDSIKQSKKYLTAVYFISIL